jgi:hypothetical protein
MNPLLFTSIQAGFQLLPTFVLAIETLFGKKTGASKKQAVTALVNASIAGTAIGLNASGNTETANAIAALQPAISATVDQTVSAFNKHGAFATSPIAAAAAANQ